MDDQTRDELLQVPTRLAVIAQQLGELLLRYDRLAAVRPEPTPTTEGDSVAGQGIEDAAPLTDDLARRDRISHLETARGALYRLLFVVDFTLAHGRVDRALLSDARATLVDGVDALDACMLLDGVGAGGVCGD